MRYRDPALATTRALVVLAVLLTMPSPALPQEPLVIPRLNGPVTLDGMSGEPAWQGIPPLPAMMHAPNSGDPPSERTEFRLAHDEDNLYVSCRLYDSHPAGIQATSLKRDATVGSNDWCSLTLDTFNDKENAFLFITNPAGIRTDGAVLKDGHGGINFDWNTFWDVATRKTEEGWFAEMRIPFSSLRFRHQDEQVRMGVIFWRRIARKDEYVTFPAISPQWGVVGLFKPSQGREFALEGIHGRSPLYVTPYLLGGRGYSHRMNALGNDYDRLDHPAREAGLDLKYNLASNLTLDLTYNTDFAQVEADDQQVNLSRFSLFFPEKRQFFQERGSVFDFSLGGSDRIFHSRRIGLVKGAQVPIHGGARLVGRVGNWEVGLLNMQTAESEYAPAENFGVLRLRRPFFGGSSYAGGVLTSRLGSDGGQNFTYGFDGRLHVFGQDYLTVNWAQSLDEGETANPLDEGVVRAQWERRGVDGLGYSIDVSRVGSDFVPAMGFIRRTGHTRIGDRISYGWRPGKESRVLHHALSVDGFLYRRNADGSTESVELGPQWKMQMKSGRSLSVAATTSYEDLERGFHLSEAAEIPAGSYHFHTARASYGAPSGALARTSVTLETGSFFDGWKNSVGVAPTWNVSEHLELSGTYQFNRITFRERDQPFNAHVARARALAMLSTRLSVSTFVQFNSAAEAVSANVRIRYNPREGSDLYLVYNEGINTERDRLLSALPFSDSRTLLLKYSHTFRPSF
jgi:hypothetical protein